MLPLTYKTPSLPSISGLSFLVFQPKVCTAILSFHAVPCNFLSSKERCNDCSLCQETWIRSLYHKKNHSSTIRISRPHFLVSQVQDSLQIQESCVFSLSLRGRSNSSYGYHLVICFWHPRCFHHQVQVIQPGKLLYDGTPVPYPSRHIRSS